MRLRSSRITITSTIAVFIICVAVLLGYQAKAVANKRFGNMTYIIDAPYIAERVTLIGGAYEQHYEGELPASYGLRYDGYYVYGDFNHDGLKDAAVIITESEGGSGEFRSLAFLINNGTTLVHHKSVFLGDRIIVNSLKEEKGQVVADMFVHQEGDCRAGPTKRAKKIYAYHNSDGRRDERKAEEIRQYVEDVLAYEVEFSDVAKKP